MPNRHHTASERSFPRTVAAFALLAVGAVWLLTRVRPGHAPSSGREGGAPRTAATPAAPHPAEPPWASVAGEEDPGAAVEPPAAAAPPRDGRG
jgi:hypothetical protein